MTTINNINPNLGVSGVKGIRTFLLHSASFNCAAWCWTEEGPVTAPTPSGSCKGSIPWEGVVHFDGPKLLMVVALVLLSQFADVGGDVASSSGSPFPGTVGYPVPSPGQRNWPASPSFQGPSPIQRLVQSPGSAGGITQPSPGASSVPQSSGKRGRQSWAVSLFFCKL